MKRTRLTMQSYAGYPHVRFDDGEFAPAMPRRGSLLYNNLTTTFFAMAVAASAAIPLLAETYTSASYVQREHLIAQWDGIDNVGTGTHDPTATEWKDLVGTRNLTLQSGGSWSAAGNALVVNGKSAEYNGTAPACKAIEVVFKMTNSEGRTLLFGGNQTTRQLIMFSDAGTNCYFEGLANVGHRLAVGNFCSGTLRSVSGTFSTPGQVASAMYVDGRQEVSGATLQNSWGNATEKIMIGIYPSGKYAWYGEVYSIRMYDCELTAREVIANHEIDEARFGEALPPSSSYTSADYVQDGLITQWDGIDNAGMGTHNPNATVWKDLAGNLDLTLTDNGSWTNGNALSVNNVAAYGSTKTPAYKTIEVVYSKPFQPGKSCVLFHSGIANRFVLFRYEVDLAPTNKVYFEAGKSTKFFYKRATPGEVTSAVALYGDDDSVVDLFCDGERKTDGTYTEGWGLRNRVSVGGRYSDNSAQAEGSPSKGEVYAIRLYSRRLTKAELARNNMIDRKRFMTSASYTQDGLIGQWDGENNVGTGIHDTRTTVWKDLKGGLDFLLTSRGSWNASGNALVVNKASAIGEVPAPSYKTLEIAYRSTYQNPVAPNDVGHNSILFNSSNVGRQMVFFRDYGQTAYFSGIVSRDTGVQHVGVSIGTFNSNAVHVLAATYTNVAAQAAVSYLDGVLNTRTSVHDSWTPNTKMILGDNTEASSRPFYGEVYALRLYDRELTADELAADAAMDQKRIFAPRVVTWENLSDGNFGTSGKWTVSGTGGQDIPRYSDRVFLPDGDYAVTLDEDWVIGELSVGADATLKLALPRSKGMLPPTPLTVLNGIEAAATAGLSLEAKGFNKEHHDKRFTLIECGSDSTAALQTLANSLNASLGRNCTVVEDGTRLVYIVPPRPGLIISVQ